MHDMRLLHRCFQLLFESGCVTTFVHVKRTKVIDEKETIP